MSARPLGVLLIALLLAGAAAGETVHMRDGRKFVGKVTREGNQLRIEMAYGTITVDESDVLIVLSGSSTEPAGPITPTTTAPRAAVRVTPKVQWDMDNPTLPEPIVFMLTRQAELLGSEGATLQEKLKQWSIAQHDGRRKVGSDWLARDAQRRMRDAFETRLGEARSAVSESRRYASPRTPEERAKLRQLELKAVQTLYEAARTWPDSLLQTFMTATLDIRAGRHEPAELHFRNCIEEEPLVAAFHQGRGLALMGLNRHLDALEEFIACLELRDDTYQSLELLEAAMKATPGFQLNDPTYLKARDLLDQYVKPDRPYTAYGKGVAWLMPDRRPWQARDETLFTPSYDRIITRQALGVPLTADALVVDEKAVEGAELIYVQAGPDLIVRAEPARTYGYSSTRRSKADIPLTAIRVLNVTFKPVEMDKPAEVKPGQTLTIRAVNLYRQMGTEIRTGSATVTAADPQGVKLDKTLLPGEPAGAAFADGAFAGFLTGRCIPAEPGCGSSHFIPPADLAEHLAQLKRGLTGRRSTRYGTPQRKEDSPTASVEGQVFLVHVLLGEAPPKEFGK